MCAVFKYCLVSLCNLHSVASAFHMVSGAVFAGVSGQDEKVRGEDERKPGAVRM